MIPHDEGFLDFDPPPADEHWQPQDDNQADWAIMKIAAAEARVAAKEAERAKAIARWDAYVEQETRQAQRDRIFFTAKLHGYLLSLREAGRLGRKKSYALPHGTLQWRAVGAKYEPQDKDALREWATKTDTVRVIIEPDMEAIRRMCLEGQEVPGMVLVRQAGDVFSVKLHEEKAGE